MSKVEISGVDTTYILLVDIAKRIYGLSMHHLNFFRRQFRHLFVLYHISIIAHFG
jgi:hypothetical protein